MDRKKKKAYDYIEGHRRETRKSYQSFIEKEFSPADSKASSGSSRPTSEEQPSLTGANWSELGEVAEMADKVRKSSRTPVPKKSFDLIDNFGTEKTVKDIQTVEAANFELSSKDAAHEFRPENVLLSVKKEPTDSDSDSFSRKSYRTPIPKKTFDLIDSGYAASAGRPHGSETPSSLPLKKSIKKETEDLVTPKKTAKTPKAKSQKDSSKDKTGVSNNQKGSSSQQKQNAKTVANKKGHDNTVRNKKQSSKSNRKRTHEQSAPEVSGVTPEAGLPKASRLQQDNLDESVLMEALQALNPNPKEKSAVTNEETAPPVTKEKKGRRSTNKMIAAKSLHKTVRPKPAEQQLVDYDGVMVKEETPDFEEPEFGLSNETYQEDANFSNAVTERPDGHLILKLGGLTSPTSAKKHKKKHKHHHHGHARKEEDPSMPLPEPTLAFSDDAYGETADPSLSEMYYAQQAAIESEPSSLVQKSTEQKHKKSKSRKRKLTAEDKAFPVVDISDPNEELFVKKRKIYKKKNGQKYLVRIQTEYWSKSGELVKVDPADGKDKSTESVKKIAKAVESSKPKEEPVANKKKAAKKSILGTPQSKKAITATTPKQKQTTPNAGNASSKLEKRVIKEKDMSEYVSTLPISAKKPKLKPKVHQDSSQSSGGSPIKKKKERKTQTLTAYLLFCRKYRQKIVSENPMMGFSEISRQLAKLWGEASEKEKEIYKKQLEEHRAKVNATKRKQNSKLKTTKQAGSTTPDKDSMALPNSSKKSSKEFQIAPQKYSVSNLEPIDMAAHLQLLGESLTLVATALRRQGNMKVHGALSVLLDSCLCSMAPLMFLTSSIPQIDVITDECKANILDNVAYILPGL